MRRLAYGLLPVVIAAPSFAADPPAASPASLSPDGKLAVAGVPCAALGVAAGPGANYVPGTDVDGNAVAPADLPHDAGAVRSDTVTIEIDRHLAGQYGIPPTGGAYGGKAIIGYVTVRDGEAYFNGQKLGAQANDALVSACRTEMK